MYSHTNVCMCVCEVEAQVEAGNVSLLTYTGRIKIYIKYLPILIPLLLHVTLVTVFLV